MFPYISKFHKILIDFQRVVFIHIGYILGQILNKTPGVSPQRASILGEKYRVLIKFRNRVMISV